MGVARLKDRMSIGQSTEYKTIKKWSILIPEQGRYATSKMN